MRNKALLGVLFAVHCAITIRALMERSYVDLFKFAFMGWPARQIFSDLTVGMVLLTSWMIADARRSGRRAWPWFVATFFVGSFGPLGYLAVGAFGRDKGTQTQMPRRGSSREQFRRAT